jgi:hypothetical protein
MKDFKKSENNLYICEECHRLCKNIKGLSTHIKSSHKNISIEEYFKKWLIDENDNGKCKICKKPTIFTGFKYFYKNCCSKKCYKKYNIIKSKEGCLKKWGVTNPNKVKEIIQRRIITRNEKKKNNPNYFIENFKKTKTEKIKNDPYYQNKINTKIKKTWLKHYGVKHISNFIEIKNKIINTKNKFKKNDPEYQININNKRKQTYIKNLGVSSPMQNTKSLEKCQISAFKLQKFKSTNLYYQGLYELDFLENFYYKYPDIIRAHSIKYTFCNKIKYYHPDFYIPSLNLIIEIKNSWLAKRDKNIIEVKKNATISKGFNYIMIIDKNYAEFRTMISN